MPPNQDIQTAEKALYFVLLGETLTLPRVGPRCRPGNCSRKDQLRGLDRPAQEETWRRGGSRNRRGPEDRGVDPNVQRMREIDSPFCLERSMIIHGFKVAPHLSIV